jgi:Glucokinase
VCKVTRRDRSTQTWICTQLHAIAGLEDYFAWASEGAHAGFAPRGKLQRELLEFAEEELQMPCEIEHLACGTGIQRIYRFLCKKRGIEAKPGYVRPASHPCAILLYLSQALAAALHYPHTLR